MERSKLVKTSMNIQTADDRSWSRRDGAASVLGRLRGVILLGGSVRPGTFISQIGRPVYLLPLESNLSILDLWRREIWRMCELLGLRGLSVKVMIDRNTTKREPAVNTMEVGSLAPVSFERDPVDYRGTGGVLHDVGRQFEDGEYILAANAAQVLTASLAETTVRLADLDADVAIVSHTDGTPSGISLIRCGALRELPPEGFVDFKEQALPAISGAGRVRVLELDQTIGMPVRSLTNYVQVVRRHHQRRDGRRVDEPFFEDWTPAFSIVEQGATAHAGAMLHDSVVLSGGSVEADAVLVQSVVCPGGIVARGRRCVDELIGGNDGPKGRIS